MLLLHVSTTRIYSSAVLVAILLLAIPKAYLWDPNIPLAYTFGYPKSGDSRMVRHIDKAASSWGPVNFKTSLQLRWPITYVKFTDNAHNGAKIWISPWPPCYNPHIEITSPPNKRIDVTMEVYFSRPRY